MNFPSSKTMKPLNLKVRDAKYTESLGAVYNKRNLLKQNIPIHLSFLSNGVGTVWNLFIISRFMNGKFYKFCQYGKYDHQADGIFGDVQFSSAV